MSQTTGSDAVETTDTRSEVERRLDAQREGLATAHDEIRSLRAELDERDAVIEELKQRILDLEDRTELQRHIERASQLSVEKRAEACIQTCVNEAQRRRRNGQPASATMDYNGARKALGGGLADQQLLDALKRADELVDGAVVRFKKEKRAAQKNSRLIVDLDAGTLPSRFQNGENSQRGTR